MFSTVTAAGLAANFLSHAKLGVLSRILRVLQNLLLQRRTVTGGVVNVCVVVSGCVVGR